MPVLTSFWNCNRTVVSIYTRELATDSREELLTVVRGTANTCCGGVGGAHSSVVVLEFTKLPVGWIVPYHSSTLECADANADATVTVSVCGAVDQVDGV